MNKRIVFNNLGGIKGNNKERIGSLKIFSSRVSMGSVNTSRLYLVINTR